jgi:uncharacterized damage-inducible protein DinB
MTTAPPSTETDVSIAFIQQARKFLTDEYLPKIERCLEKLTDEQIWWRPNPESNSIGNLLLHLSGNARQWIVCGLGDVPDERVRQAEFDERRNIPRDELIPLLRGTVKAVDDTLAAFAPERLLDRFKIQGTDSTALAAIFHVTEHVSMHTGQIILLTKLLSGSDLQFYGFEGDKPVHSWHTPSSHSSEVS